MRPGTQENIFKVQQNDQMRSGTAGSGGRSKQIFFKSPSTKDKFEKDGK